MTLKYSPLNKYSQQLDSQNAYLGASDVKSVR